MTSIVYLGIGQHLKKKKKETKNRNTKQEPNEYGVSKIKGIIIKTPNKVGKKKNSKRE